MNVADKRIVVTGGAGFLGSHVCEQLRAKGANPYIIRSRDAGRNKNEYVFDLTKESEVKLMYKLLCPHVVIHLAAVVGGIGINREKPGTFYYKNLMMGALLLEHAKQHSIEKFIALGTICAYPKYTPVPFKEEDLWNGYPEETNAPYGIAKKAMLVQSQAYRKEFGLNSIYLLPVNLYGPRDNFNPNSSHVIPALIKKCIDARNTNAESITCWGTGSATREFLYVDDAAEGIILATEKYDREEPVNLGTQSEISIKELVTLIAKLTKYTGKIVWDANFPDGQPRRCLDTTRAENLFGFKAKTSFEDGLQKTIAWYENSLTKVHQ